VSGGAPGRSPAPSAVRRRWSTALTALLVTLTAGCHTEAACGSAAGATSSHAATRPPPAGYPFGPASAWRTDIRHAPVAADSAALVHHLAGTVSDRYGGVAAFNARQFGNSFYTATPDTPRVDVAFDDCQQKGYLPDGLTGPEGQFTGVPIPAGAVGATGTDRMMSVYAPGSDQLWEFWVVNRWPEGGWSACWGGRIDAVSRSAGFFRHGFGATATGLSASGGMVSLADVRSGAVQHALSLVVPDVAANRYSWPAQRSDGSATDADAIPEGTRLRLDPSVDVSKLHLSPVARMIARAAQQYGFLVVDKGPGVAVVAEEGTAESALTGRDPWLDILGTTPAYEVLKNFPWKRLQSLPHDYGKPSLHPCT
jgi:hypothetical protein